MQDVRTEKEKRLGKEAFGSIDIGIYESKTFGMFGGEEETVTLACTERAADAIIDRFGTEPTFIAPISRIRWRSCNSKRKGSQASLFSFVLHSVIARDERAEVIMIADGKLQQIERIRHIDLAVAVDINGVAGNERRVAAEIAKEADDIAQIHFAVAVRIAADMFILGKCIIVVAGKPRIVFAGQRTCGYAQRRKQHERRQKKSKFFHTRLRFANILFLL